MKTIRKEKNETGLKGDVRKIINRYAKDYDNGVEGFFKDLFYGGCKSGIIGELVYYSDTIKFFNKHKKEISCLLYDTLSNTGINDPVGLFPDWDKEDPLCLVTNNQNLMAWFSFEETARKFSDHLGFEV